MLRIGFYHEVVDAYIPGDQSQAFDFMLIFGQKDNLNPQRTGISAGFLNSDCMT